MTATDRLLDIMARLRDPETGCPWDVQQSFATIAPYTVEEAYEVADAIERDDMPALRDELGDLLLQVVFHAQMACEAKLFDFHDVADTISDKMVRRHPHVFAGTVAETGHEVHHNWEAIKAGERADKGRHGTLDDVPVALPALMRAEKLQRRAARVGFDWPEAGQVLDKIEEEVGELRAELAGADHDRVEDEIGDLLFAVANIARFLKVDPEAALRRTNAKFERRFRYIEERLAARGQSLPDASLDEMEELWQEAKEGEPASAA